MQILRASMKGRSRDRAIMFHCSAIPSSMLNYMAHNGYRHHVAFVRGSWSEAVVEAFSYYLGYEIDRI